MSLKVNVRKNNDGSFVLSPAGSIDSDTYQVLEKELKIVVEEATRGVVLDMAKVEYVSSIGIGVIMRSKLALEKKGLALALSDLHPDVKRVFEAVKLISDSVFATLEGADQYLDQYIAFIHGKGKGKDPGAS